MKYRVEPGQQLVISVDSGAWEQVTFEARDFRTASEPTGREIAAAISRKASAAASVDSEGCLILSTNSRGGGATLEIDFERSTAAAGLGLTGQACVARGSGLRPAQVVSIHKEPFQLPKNARMTVLIDGKPRQIVFEGGARGASAADVARAINGKRSAAPVAFRTRDGEVRIASPSARPESSVEIRPGAGPDAAGPLGFTGLSAFDKPHSALPAAIVCGGTRASAALVNQSPGPVELHLASGTISLGTRESRRISLAESASEDLQRLINQGVVAWCTARDRD